MLGFKSIIIPLVNNFMYDYKHSAIIVEMNKNSPQIIRTWLYHTQIKEFTDFDKAMTYVQKQIKDLNS